MLSSIFACLCVALLPGSSSFQTSILSPVSKNVLNNHLEPPSCPFVRTPPPSNSKRDVALSASIDRRNALSFLATAPLVLPLIANAETLSTPAALRQVRRSLRELKEMESIVSSDDYAQVKAAIRVPPFTEVRRNCSILFRSFPEESSERTSLESKYKVFVTSLERLDSKAGLGVRGKKGEKLQGDFDATVKGLEDFLDEAGQLFAPPETEPETSDILKIQSSS